MSIACFSSTQIEVNNLILCKLDFWRSKVDVATQSAFRKVFPRYATETGLIVIQAIAKTIFPVIENEIHWLLLQSGRLRVSDILFLNNTPMST